MKLADDDSGRDGRLPARTADWRERTAIKGGPPAHLFARGGWAAGAGLGAVATPAAVALSGALAGSSAGAVLLALVVLFLAGAVSGAVLGALAQQGVRSWLLAPTQEEQRAERKVQARAQRFDASDLASSSWWRQRFHSCSDSVEAFHQLVDATPTGQSRDWLADIGERLDDELAEALRLARLGDRLADQEQEEPSQERERLAERLREAEAAFAATLERASTIATGASGETGFSHLHAELDMLAEQAPQLRAADSDRP